MLQMVNIYLYVIFQSLPGNSIIRPRHVDNNWPTGDTIIRLNREVYFK